MQVPRRGTHGSVLLAVVSVKQMSSRKSSSPRSRVQVWIDGALVAPENALVSVFDRGFLYGDSIFETLRTYGGAPFALLEHMVRLSQSAARVFIDLPATPAELAEEVQSATARSGFAECYVRLMVTRGEGELGLDPGLAHRPLRVMLVAPLTPPPREDYERGISAVTFQTSRVGDATSAAGAKVGNYLVAVLASRKAREHGAKEALITGADGTVIEGATSNLFWLEGGVLWTVPLSAGILPGITRAHILSVARDLGVGCAERTPRLAELLASDAVFISSSIREILPVIAIDQQRVSTGQVHPLVRELHAAFRTKAGVAPLHVDEEA